MWYCEPITITVSDDSITVGPEELKNKYYIFEPAKEATETQEADMAAVTIGTGRPNCM